MPPYTQCRRARRVRPNYGLLALNRMQQGGAPAHSALVGLHAHDPTMTAYAQLRRFR
jgi:hypothetical protein